MKALRWFLCLPVAVLFASETPGLPIPNPTTADTEVVLGDQALQRGDFDEAYDHYRTALDQRPDLANYRHAARLLWLTGDSSQAVILMTKAIKAGASGPSELARCRADLAMMEFHRGALLPAGIEAAKALALAPEDPHVLAVAARIAAARGDLERAILDYGKSMEIAPSGESMIPLAELHQLAGNESRAADLTARLIALHPFHSQAPGQKATDPEFALFLADQDRPLDSVIADLENDYETMKTPAIENALAWCYHKQGDSIKARRMIERARRWNTPDARMTYHAALIYLKLGGRTKARALLGEALALNPNFHPVHSGVAARTLKKLLASNRAAPR